MTFRESRRLPGAPSALVVAQLGGEAPRPGCAAPCRAWPACSRRSSSRSSRRGTSRSPICRLVRPSAMQLEDLALLLGQRRRAPGPPRGRCAAARAPAAVTAGSSSDWPGRDPADRVDEVVAADLLEDVARGAGHDRGEQRLVVVVRGEDQRTRSRGPRSARRGRRRCRCRRAAGRRARRRAGRSAGIRRVASSARPDSPTTSMSAVALEQLAQPAADDLVVVEEEDADQLAVCAGLAGRGLVFHAPILPIHRTARTVPRQTGR